MYIRGGMGCLHKGGYGGGRQRNRMCGVYISQASGKQRTRSDGGTLMWTKVCGECDSDAFSSPPTRQIRAQPDRTLKAVQTNT